ncbi:hypothetical protein GCM10028809_60770 [Spirosoma gilvum]
MAKTFQILVVVTPVTSFDPELGAYRNRVNQGFFMFIAFSLYVLMNNHRIQSQNYQMQQQMQAIKLKAEKLEKENIQSQFTALKNQVNPHFLFNSLSILASLIRNNVNLAGKFITQLAKAYRYILEQKDNDLVLLQTELQFIEAYTFLLKIRFKDKFDVQFALTSSQASSYMIAPLTLQLLLENVVKHNQMSLKNPLLVKVEICQQKLVVTNRLQIRQSELYSTGVGLSNIINRYQLLTNQPVEVDQTSHQFTVKIPLIDAL